VYRIDPAPQTTTGDLAQLTDKCSAFDKQASCVTNSLCKWGKVGHPRCHDGLM
jgi:hypothetical protein